jgi:outer membrane lipoprotein LolB
MLEPACRLRQWLALALLASLLAGCAGQQARVAGDASWAQHQARLQALDNWIAEGKLALRSTEISESASLNWQQTPTRTTVHLSGPMGFKATTIESDGSELELRQGDEISRWDISDPEAMARQTGWNLPLQALPHWLKGIPAPVSGFERVAFATDPSLLGILQQEGWTVTYGEYARFADLTLPTRLQIQQGDTSIRVIIRDWTIPGPL